GGPPPPPAAEAGDQPRPAAGVAAGHRDRSALGNPDRRAPHQADAQAAAGGAPVAGGAESSGTGLPPDSGKNRSSGGDCSSAAEGAAGSLRIGPVRSEPLHRDSLLSHQMRLLH